MDASKDKPMSVDGKDGRQSLSEDRAALRQADLLSGDSLTVPAASAVPAEDRHSQPVPQGDSLMLHDVLAGGDTSGGAAHPDAGGFLTFDTESSPGNTIVRVIFEGSGSEEVVGTFSGGEMNINDLLGLLGPDPSSHS